MRIKRALYQKNTKCRNYANPSELSGCEIRDSGHWPRLYPGFNDWYGLEILQKLKLEILQKIMRDF